MSKDEVLGILKQSEGFVSGEDISRRIGLSRAAVWKTVKLLKREGYTISSRTNRGYKLEAVPDVLDANSIKRASANDELVICCMESVDSTNNALKRMALDGACEGTVLVADSQTAGRGRLGRSFSSPKGKGVYMSVLLKPESVEHISGLTCMTAAAVCRAIEKITRAKPRIKWTNDVLLEGKKLCGILTELSTEGESGGVRFVVIGVGVNVNHEPEDFPPEIQETACSLYSALGKKIDRNRLAGELAGCIFEMYGNLKKNHKEYMDEYRQRCVTLGKTVEFTRGDSAFRAVAESVEDDGALMVRLAGGEELRLMFGEVSIVAAD